MGQYVQDKTMSEDLCCCGASAQTADSSFDSSQRVIKKGENSMAKKKMQDFGFLATLFIWPTIVIIVTYFYANTNFIFLAFQKYTYNAAVDPLGRFGWYEFLSFGELFSNFSLAWSKLVAIDVGTVIKNSVLNYAVGLFAITPLQIFVGFAIYKKVKGVQMYIIILYLPQVIASMVWVIIYRQMISLVIPTLIGKGTSLGLLLTTIFTNTTGNGMEVLIILWVYVAWVNLGGAMMIITGMFARIEHEIVEAAQIDGCNLWKEFWHISFPHYWPVFSISVFTGIAGLFTGMPPLYEFYAADAPQDSWTFGYYFYKMVVSGYMDSRVDYPEASAAGLIMTVIVVPIVLVTKWLVERADKMEGSV